LGAVRNQRAPQYVFPLTVHFAGVVGNQEETKNMHQLSGMDSSFLYMETGNTPMHIGSLAIYDQSTAPGGKVAFKDILQFFDERLHKARAFRQRLARVPLSLDHPYWIEDPDFDLEFHVRHIALPAPGDCRQ
jgi:diacylglycerol O-acyltransferase